jgi:hypothetical protein
VVPRVMPTMVPRPGTQRLDRGSGDEHRRIKRKSRDGRACSKADRFAVPGVAPM